MDRGSDRFPCEGERGIGEMGEEEGKGVVCVCVCVCEGEGAGARSASLHSLLTSSIISLKYSM